MATKNVTLRGGPFDGQVIPIDESANIVVCPIMDPNAKAEDKPKEASYRPDLSDEHVFNFVRPRQCGQ